VTLWQSFCLNTNTRTGCWRSNTRTTKTDILLFLNVEVFVSLFVCFISCLFVLVCSSLPVDFFGVFFVSFIIVN
jgi:hypothetical protein